MSIKNWWSNRSYWLKGGIMTVGFALLLYIFTVVVQKSFNCSGMNGYAVDECYAKINLVIRPVSSFLLFFDFISLVFCKGICKGFSAFISIYTIWPSFFIIGAFLGWIYGRVKTRAISQTTQGRSGILGILIKPFIVLIGIILLFVMVFFAYSYYHIDGKNMVGGFNILHDNVYAYSPPGWGENDSPGPKKINGIDISSFKILGSSGSIHYASDKNGVYLLTNQDVYTKNKSINLSGLVITGADPETFAFITRYEEDGDGKQVTITDMFYTEDKNHIYFMRSIVEGADLETFKLVGKQGSLEEGMLWDATDRNHYYFSGRIGGDINPPKKWNQ